MNHKKCTGTYEQIKQAILKNQELMTDEQKSAVNAEEGKNILVSAAAGSGKTFVLIQRILKLIAVDNKDIRGMLLATFTNAAAAQMSKKIYDALNKLVYEQNINSEHLKKQIAYLNSSDICTLHSFCIKIIKNYFYVTGMNYDFSIIDGADDMMLKTEAIDELIEDMYANADSEFLKLADIYTTAKGAENLKDIILKSYDYAQSRPEGLKWLKNEIEYYNYENCQKSKWAFEIYNECINILRHSQSFMKKAINIAQGYLDIKSICQLNEEENKIGDLINAIENAYENYFNFEPADFGALRISTKYRGAIKDEIKNLRDEAKELYKEAAAKMRSLNFSKVENENKIIYKTLSALYKAAEQFNKIYGEKKAKRKAITFNDCEHICLDILQNDEIATEIKKNYEFIFIDEYQDISPLQEEILKLISRDDNLFMVGDIKQSIYRFRLADADIFKAKYDNFKNDNNRNELIILNKNFRSAKNIINCVNAVFEKIMDKNSAGIDYDNDARLVYANKENLCEYKTDIYIFTKTDDACEEENDAKNSNDILSDYENTEIEAVNTANIIKDLLNTQIYDKEHKIYRNAEYKDIVILLQSANIDGQSYCQILNNNNIPASFDAGKGYFDNLEVSLILNLLYVIDNDYSDIALIAVMRAPFFDFSLKDLMKIRNAHNHGFFYEAANNYKNNYNDDLSERLNKFYAFIKKYRKKSRYLSIYNLLINIYKETAYYEYVSLLEEGSSRKDNLTQLLNIAKKYEKTGTGGLFGFINYIEKIKASKADAVNVSSAQKSNSVKIMSIHKSKGLEFPIVIIGRTHKEFNKSDLQKEIIFHKKLGVGAVYYDTDLGYKCDSLAKKAIKSACEDELIAEQLRLLYVALTRAEQRLIITCLKTNKDINNDMRKYGREKCSIFIKKFSSFIDWILYALTDKDVIADEEIFNVIYKECTDFCEKKDKKFTKKDIYHMLKNSKAEIDEQTEQKLNYRYGFESGAALPSKMTVTQIKRNMAKTFITENTDEQNFLSMRKGTIFHYIMQNINLEQLKTSGNYEKYISNYIESLEKENIITTEESKAINIKKIAKFFNSKTGILLLDAENIKREVEFYYKADTEIIDKKYKNAGDVYIQGVIDCIAYCSGWVYIIDYKTDIIYDNIKKKEKIEEYSLQLKIYKKAYEEITNNKNVKCILSFINMEQNIEI